MANTIVLRGREFVLGDLTAATLEDFPDAVRDFFAIREIEPGEPGGLGGAKLRAVITLATEAIRRGGFPDVTRDEFREAVQLPDLVPLYSAVGRALGLYRAVAKEEADPGEARSPGSSPPSASSSGA